MVEILGEWSTLILKICLGSVEVKYFVQGRSAG